MERDVRISDLNSISVRKAAYFLGIAKIDLDQLAFDVASPDGHRKESKKIQTKLINVFKLEGCRRLEQQHFIDALISRETLSAALQFHGQSIESFRGSYDTSDGSLRDVLRLRLSGPLQCLSGLHRVAAAKRYLNKNDRWWTVRLYEKDRFEADLTNHIQETFGHEQHYTDGTIFRNIRRYHRSGDEENEKKWWARLTPSKRRDLKQLLKDKECTSAFDGLIDLPGLWPPVQLGTLHRQHGLRCSEEMINYLKHIQTIWYAIIPQDMRLHLDEYTVHELELLAPALSDSDQRKIRGLFERGLVFSSVTDRAKREDLLHSVLTQRCLIPSLRTFFENQKYLEPCSMILKSLLDDSDKRSIWQSFQANFFSPDTIQLQVNEGSSEFEDLPLAEGNNTEVACRLGYIQLWLFCFRHFPEMTAIKPRLEMRTSQQTQPQSTIAALMPKLARLAVTLGFRTDKAVSLANEDSDLLVAEQFLQSSIPDLTIDISKHVVHIKRVLADIRASSECLPISTCSEFTASQPLLKERRCGRPFEQDHIQDCETLFVPLLYAEVESGAEFSSLYAKADIFKAFFKHCMPLEDNVVRDLSSTWIRETERRTTAHAGRQQSWVNDTMEGLQQDDESELRSPVGSAFPLEAPLQRETISVQADCSQCSDRETLKAEVEQLRSDLIMKDIEIRRVQEEMAVDNDAFFGDHRNEDVGVGYDKLMHDYTELKSAMSQLKISSDSDIKSLQGSVDALTRDRNELQSKYTELQQDYNTQSIAVQRNNALESDLARIKKDLLDSQGERQRSQEGYVTSLAEQRDRIAELEKEVVDLTSQLSAARDLYDSDTEALERHRRLSFPFQTSADERIEHKFQSDIRHILRQREISAEHFTVREILFDEEGLGLRSRLFQLEKTKVQVEDFLAWLCPSERYVFSRCFTSETGSVSFKNIPTIDAETLIKASGLGVQIFCGLKECFLPMNFPRRYKNCISFIPSGSKRKGTVGGPKPKRFASARRRGTLEGVNQPILDVVPYQSVVNESSGVAHGASPSLGDVQRRDEIIEDGKTSPMIEPTVSATRAGTTYGSASNAVTYEDMFSLV